MKLEVEREVLYAIMREASYLRRGSAVRKAIEATASERLRELRVPAEQPHKIPPGMTADQWDEWCRTEGGTKEPFVWPKVAR